LVEKGSWRLRDRVSHPVFVRPGDRLSDFHCEVGGDVELSVALIPCTLNYQDIGTRSRVREEASLRRPGKSAYDQPSEDEADTKQNDDT